jgi:hypothetical protein
MRQQTGQFGRAAALLQAQYRIMRQPSQFAVRRNGYRDLVVRIGMWAIEMVVVVVVYNIPSAPTHSHLSR